ncbi:MAG: hypothetical protein PHQ19_06475 [Candidatus Krumholzibacteria bacterium]|nr:hypothetical protein [Candidatus Krumholzibacteria bacterium]
MTDAERTTTTILICAACFAAALLLFHYIPDDAYIGFRYARNAARGAGLVFNEGERVEGYTNFLWVAILSSAARAGLPIVETARALSLLFSAGTIAAAAAAAGACARGPGGGAWPGPRRAALSTAAILCASTPLAAWALSGTEIPLYAFLLTCAILLLVSSRPPAAVFAVLALLALTRPDGAVFYPLAAALLLRRGERPAAVARAGLLVGVALAGPWLAWKLSYYGGIVPNTFYAKTGPAGLMLRNGIAYTAGFAAWHAWGPAAAVIACGRRPGALSVPLAFILVHWAAVTATGGDWMPLYRLLAPTIPAAAIITGTFAGAGCPHRGRRLATAAVLTALFAGLAAAPGAAARGNLRRERVIVGAFAQVGRTLGAVLPAGTVIACGSTGAIGYYSGLPIVDILGLTEPAIARGGTIVSRQPGHLKSLGRHVLDRGPDLILLGNIQIHRGAR